MWGVVEGTRGSWFDLPQRKERDGWSTAAFCQLATEAWPVMLAESQTANHARSFSNPGLDVDHLSLRIIYEKSPVGSKTLRDGNDAKYGADVIGGFGVHYFFRSDLG